MRIVRSSEAEMEVDDAFQFYAARSKTVARAFLDDLSKATDRLAENPRLHAAMRGGFRRCFLTRFPYQIIYRMEENDLRIYAVAQFKRRPGYWRSRVPG